MSNKEFADLLERAIAGNNEALVAVLDEYIPLFRRCSVFEKGFDEDCYQYVLTRAIEMTRRYRIKK
jgi:hypothetical protein